jgi:uncharacterized protein YjbI with pentapeptide repeats
MPAFITTFYSYKGGVGRSILAANVAALLARRGKTLLWDLDLEAPGLHRIHDLKGGAANRGGFFEWLLDWQTSWQIGEGGEATINPPTAELCAALAARMLPVAAQKNLFVLPAHAERADFAKQYLQIDWAQFLVTDANAGLDMLRALLTHFADVAGCKYIVLDSRTGITDIGGLLTLALPNATVFVGNYSAQNTGGLRSIWDALQSRKQDPIRGDLPPLECALIASPIPLDNPQRAVKLREQWSTDFALAADIIIEIPEDPRLRGTDGVLALTSGQREDATLDRYRAVAERLLSIETAHLQAIAASAQALLERSDSPRQHTSSGKLVGQLGALTGSSTAVLGKTFEERSADLLRLLGYAVEPEQTVDGNRVDLIARIKTGLEETAYFVECKNHKDAIGKDIVDKLLGWVSNGAGKAQNARGMVIANRFSPQALEWAKACGIRCLTPSDLERSLVDFSKYLSNLRSTFAASPLATCYVDQFITPESRAAKSRDGESEDVPALPHGATWATGLGSRLWVLLGDYGTGKTAYTQRLAFELAERALGNPDAPVPLLINLRDFANKVTLADVLHEHWHRATGQRQDPKVLEYLHAQGRIVLLLDSFDEMGVAQAHREVVEQFRALAAPPPYQADNPRASRVLITCREQFFREQGEAKKATSGHSDSLAPLERAARGFEAAIETLPVFSDAQIADYLNKRLGKVEAEKALVQIETIYGLKGLATRPQLLEIIIRSLPRLAAAGGEITAGKLYWEYTTEWLESNQIRLIGTQASPDQLRTALESLALQLLRRQNARIHYADLNQLIRADTVPASGQDPANFDIELRTAAFLSRTADGFYGFSHRSFLEFFVARALHRCFAAAPDVDALIEALNCPPLSVETISFVFDLFAITQQKKNAQLLLVDLLTTADAPVKSRTNALFVAYVCAWSAETVEALDLSASGSDAWHAQMAAMLQAQLVWLPASGAQLQGVDLSDVRIDGLHVPNANFDGATLNGAMLNGANLVGASFVGASLRKTELTLAAVQGANFSGARCDDASATNANLNGIQAQNSLWPGATLVGADLHDADFSHADLTRTNLIGANTQGATFDHALMFGAPRALLNIPAPLLRLPAMQGHWNSVTSVALSAKCDRVLTGSWDDTAKLWNSATGALIQTFTGHKDWVTSVALSASGDQVLTGSDDHTAKLWNAATGALIQTFTGHKNWVTSVALSASGDRVLTGSHDHTAKLWNSATGALIQTFSGHENSVTSVALSASGDRVLTGSDDNAAKLWNSATGALIQTFTGHENYVTSVALSAGGDRVLTGSWDNTAKLWNSATGALMHTFSGHENSVTSVALSVSGDRVLTGSYDGSTRCWDAHTGAALRLFWGEGESGLSIDLTRLDADWRLRSGVATPLAVGTQPALDAAVLMDPDEPQIDHPRWVPTRWQLSDCPQYLAGQAN